MTARSCRKLLLKAVRYGKPSENWPVTEGVHDPARYGSSLGINRRSQLRQSLKHYHLSPPFSPMMFHREQIRCSMIGDQLGNWKIIKKINRGGMADIYLAEEVNSAADE